NTVVAYQDYLQKYAGGQYSKEATRAIKDLEKTPAAFDVRKISLGILAVLLVGLVVWQVASFGDTKEADENAANTQDIETLSDGEVMAIDTTSITEKQESPKQAEETPVKEEVNILPLELTQKWGNDEIIVIIEGGKAPYTLRLLKGKSEKYSRAYRQASTYRIPITKAYRADAGQYILALEDGTGEKASKKLSIDPLPESKPSPPKTTTSSAAFKEPSMVRVAGGTFTMGCQEGRDKNCYDREKPAHQVTLSSYYIGKYEVTNEEFCAFLNEKGNQEEGGKTWLELESEYCKISKSGGNFVPKSGYANHPVVEVSWYGSRAYCKWLSTQTGKRYRLPSEAEWEFAARGGNRSNDYSYAGSNTLNEVAWYRSNSGSDTHPVGRKKANELGIHDMSGNVWEWCADYWHSDYKGAPNNGSAWTSGGDNSRRVVRGGSWNIVDYYCRVSYRDRNVSNGRSSITGFRIAR
ncbi:MAG: formylglycine-generating enzyme family protein, partial [Bacteroidota bacterium]